MTPGEGPVKLNPHLITSTMVAALGGLLLGFDTAVIAGTTRELTAAYGLSPASLGFTVSSALWGTILGAMFAGVPGDRYGRRDSLRGLAVIYLVSAIGCALAWNWPALVFFRFIEGIAIGGSSVLGPMYIAEISPAKWRGRLVGCFQFSVVFGVLLAYLSNYLLGLAALGEAEWRWKLGISAAPAAFFLAMLFTIPRSPRWLVSKDRLTEARESLRLTGDEDPDRNLQQIIDAIDREKKQGEDRLFARQYRTPVFLAVSIGVFNQLTGINAILYYLNSIFENAGFSKVSGDLQSVAVGATNLVFTMIAMSVIDRFGRKVLLLAGSIGMALCLAGVAAIFFLGTNQHLLVWLLMGYIAAFGFSQGAVIWVYLSEVFPTRVRAKGQSLGSSAHWIMNAFISGIFPLMAASSGGFPFVFFAAMMVVQFFVVLRWYPETKEISLEQMQKNMGIA